MLCRQSRQRFLRSSISCSSNGKYLFIACKDTKSKAHLQIFESHISSYRATNLKLRISSKIEPFKGARHYPKLRVVSGNDYVYVTNGKEILQYDIRYGTSSKVPFKRNLQPVALSVFNEKLFFLCKLTNCVYEVENNNLILIISNTPYRSYDLAVNDHYIFIASIESKNYCYQLNINVYKKNGILEHTVPIPTLCKGDLIVSVGSITWREQESVLYVTHCDMRISCGQLYNIWEIEKKSGNWNLNKSCAIEDNPSTLAWFHDDIYVSDIDNQIFRYNQSIFK